MDDVSAAVAGDVTEIKRKVDRVLAQEKLIAKKMDELGKEQEKLAAEARRIQVGIAGMFDRIAATQAGIDELKQEVASLKRAVLSQLETIMVVMTSIGADVKVILRYVVEAEVRRARQLELRNLLMEMEDFVGQVRDRIALHVIASQLLETLRTRAITKYTFDDVPDRAVFVRVTTTLQNHRDALTPAERDELSAYRGAAHERERASDLLRKLTDADEALRKAEAFLNSEILTLSGRTSDLRQNATSLRERALLRARTQDQWTLAFLLAAAAIVAVALLATVGGDVAFLAVLPWLGAVIMALVARGNRNYSPDREASRLDDRVTKLRAELHAANASYIQTLDSIRADAATALPTGTLSKELRRHLELVRLEHDRACSAFMGRHGEMRLAA
jgi:hypothetical protein